MDATQMGTTFDIQGIYGVPSIFQVTSPNTGVVAWVRTNAGMYIRDNGDGVDTPADNVFFNGSSGTWSNNNQTLTINLDNLSGNTEAMADGMQPGTLTLYIFPGAIGADGVRGVNYQNVTTIGNSSF